ncbi:MAG: DUF4231 domain-containing protein [Desulfobulbaceae bacterium]|nr:DUF4231 domain-containing protein [Desulfobulbaceae bacterium]
MNASDTPSQDKNSFAMAYAWGQYRVYAHTSRKKKKTLVTWRFIVVMLGIGGAFLGLLCQDIARLLEICEFSNKKIWYWTPDFLRGYSHFAPKILGALSALALGLATYFGKELVSPEQEREWIRSRSTAESLKSEIYKFFTNTAPYNDDDKAKRLLKETEKLLESVKDIPYANLSEEEKVKRLPSDLSTVEDYIKQRVNDQIEEFYRPRSEEYTRRMELVKHIGLVIGVVVIFLGALGATGWTAGWVAFFTTITASIAAYAYAGRYQYLIISYQATANRLELLRTRWQASGMTDRDAEQRNRFILDCEEAISIENSAWMAKTTKESGDAVES